MQVSSSILTKVNRSSSRSSNMRGHRAHKGVYVAEEPPIIGVVGAPRGVNVPEEVPSMNDLGSQGIGEPLASRQ